MSQEPGQSMLKKNESIDNSLKKFCGKREQSRRERCLFRTLGEIISHLSC